MEKTIRTHRVGTITAGLSLIAFGVMFVLHLVTDIISYDIIFRLWPFMLIGLGVELLLSNLVSDKFIYDKAAVFLIIIMSFFAISMAGADLFFQYFKDGKIF